MKRIFILLILITGTISAAEPLVKNHAYIVSSINKSETVGAGESFSLVPQIVVATGSEKYIGSVSTFTGCYGGKRYETGVEVGNWAIRNKWLENIRIQTLISVKFFVWRSNATLGWAETTDKYGSFLILASLERLFHPLLRKPTRNF